MASFKGTCFLCRSFPEYADIVPFIEPTPLHCFPKDPSTRRKWMENCGLNPEDLDNTGLKLCCRHFTSEDYNSLDQRKFRLRRSAVPHINIPLDAIQYENNSGFIDEELEQLEDDVPANILNKGTNNGQVNKSKINIITVHTIKRTPSFAPPTLNPEIDTLPLIESQETIDEELQTDVASEETFELPEHSELYEENPVKMKPFSIVIQKLPKNTIKVPESSGGVKQGADRFIQMVTSKKRKYLVSPTFVDELSCEDFSTPKRARHMLKILREEFKKKTEHVLHLRRLNRLQRSKIENTVHLIGKLRKDFHISEEAEEMILASLCSARLSGQKLMGH